MKWIRLYFSFKYEGDDEKILPVTEAGEWKAAEKTDLIGTWKVRVVFALLHLKKLNI